MKRDSKPVDFLALAFEEAKAIPLKDHYYAAINELDPSHLASMTLPQVIEHVTRVLSKHVAISEALFQNPPEDLDHIDLQAEIGRPDDEEGTFDIDHGRGLHLDKQPPPEGDDVGANVPGPLRSPVLTDGVVASGTLHEGSFLSLLIAAYTATLNGVISMTDGDRIRVFFFLDGHMVEARSNDPADRLAEILFQEGRLDEEAHRAAIRATALNPDDEGAFLVSRRLISPHAQFSVICHQYECIALRTMAAKEGRWAYEPNGLSSARFMLDIPLPALIMKLCRLGTVVHPAHRMLYVGAWEFEQGVGVCPIEDLRLTDNEHRVFAQLSGRMTLSDVAHQFKTDGQTISALLSGLLALGFVTIRSDAGIDVDPYP